MWQTSSPTLLPCRWAGAPPQEAALSASQATAAAKAGEAGQTSRQVAQSVDSATALPVDAYRTAGIESSRVKAL